MPHIFFVSLFSIIKQLDEAEAPTENGYTPHVTRQQTAAAASPVKSSPVKTSAVSNGGAKSKLAAAAASSHKVTEYFSVRRSQRAKQPAGKLRRPADQPGPEVEAALERDHDRGLGLGVRDFPEKGRGVVAERVFARGEFVVEYAGDLIDVCEAKQRESDYSMDLSTGCYMYYFKHKGKQYCIDATSETGRLGRLVNHSRLTPNLQTKVVTHRDGRPRLILVARKEVAAEEELLYDYGDRSKESLKAHPWLSL